MAFSDGPTGVRGLEFAGGRTAASSQRDPAGLSLERGDRARVGALLAEEAERQQIHVVLGPDDQPAPLPAGRPAVRGLLRGPAAHRPARGGVRPRPAGARRRRLPQAPGRQRVRDRAEHMNCVVDERTLREVYLLPFEIAVEDAEPWSVMAAYNDVNGVAGDRAGRRQQRGPQGRVGLDGLLMSDWFATKSAGPAANGGLDLVMPGPDGPVGRRAGRRGRDGAVRRGGHRRARRRLLLLAERVGALGAPRTWPADVPAPDSAVAPRAAAPARRRRDDRARQRRHAAARRAAARVALIGRHAVETVVHGRRLGAGQPAAPGQRRRGAGRALGDRSPCVDGVEVRTGPVPARRSRVTDPATGEPGMRVEHFDADGALLEHAHGAEASTDMVGLDDDLPRPSDRQLRLGARAAPARCGSARWAPATGSSGRRAPSGAASRRPVAGRPGRGDASAAGLDDRRRPTSSRPTLTAEAPRAGHRSHGMLGAGRRAAAARRPTTRSRPRSRGRGRGRRGGGRRRAHRGAGDRGRGQDHARAARASRTLWSHAVAAAARRTVVVVNAATPVLMPWLDEVDAVLWAGLPGQEGGHAVADALLGDREPAGRLVTTFPAADGATPGVVGHPDRRRARLRRGHLHRLPRHCGRAAPEPAFWFGHGLGYGAWAYARRPPVTGDAPCHGRRSPTPATGLAARSCRSTSSPPNATASRCGWSAGRRSTWRPGGRARRGHHGRAAVADVGHRDRVLATLDGGELLVARGLGDVRDRLRP